MEKWRRTRKNPRAPGQLTVVCPECKSDNVEMVNMNYPKAYECCECKYSFVKGTQALIDE